MDATGMERCAKNRKSVKRRISVQLVVDFILWAAVGLPVLFLFLKGTPVEIGFFCDDPSLSYPYKPDTISTPLLIILGFGTSVLLVVLAEALNSISSRCTRYCQTSEDLAYCCKGYSVFLLGFVVQELLVDTMKNQMGFLRPNFFDVCQPSYNTSQCPGYVHLYECSGTDVTAKELKDIRQSFPSGHAAFSMYIAMYFCFYLNDRLQLFYSRVLKFFLQSGLLLLSLVCGLLRVYDNKHHLSDVIAGFAIGITVAVAVYKTVGKTILIGDSKEHTVDVKDRSADRSHKLCCACASSGSREMHTPSSLLQPDYSSHSLHSALLQTKTEAYNDGVKDKKETILSLNGELEEV